MLSLVSENMKDLDGLIRILVREMSARSGDMDSLHLPEHWDEATWGRLLADAEIIETTNGQVLLERNDPSNDLYFLIDGQLEVSVPRASSDSLSPIATIGPGAVVGEMAFFDNHSRSACVWSKGKSMLFRLRRSAFEEFKQAEPQLACDLLMAIGRILAERLRHATSGSGKRDKTAAFGGGY